jgi:hypothetical protein
LEFHLERGLRLITHSDLDDWAIQEVDGTGQPIGEDKIPWPWTLRFTATSCLLGDSFEIKSEFESTEGTPIPAEMMQRQVIRVQLRPGAPQDDGDLLRKTTYSMFGTDRDISRFQLDIHPIADPTEQESCRSWGLVSYSAEGDFFSKETMDDCIGFDLFVKPETFARYAAKIAHGLVDEIILSVRLVDGFYSAWSPTILTPEVKVLTGGKEQKLSSSPGHQVKPPRLGRVGEATMYINRGLEFGKRALEFETIDDVAESVTRANTATQAIGADTLQMLRILGSLRRAAWLVVCLLTLIFISTLSKG